MSILQLLDELGWSQTLLAKVTGVHQSTVSRWLNRGATPPKVVLAYLELRLQLKRLTEE